MHSNSALDPLACDYRPSCTALPRQDTLSTTAQPDELTHLLRPRVSPALAREAHDTGVEFLALYRKLLWEIESWCQPTGAPITQIIRRRALRDYVEVYCHTYPRQPSYPFPPRFGRYAAYLDGFDEIVDAIDSWCEWLSRQFLPGVVPIHLIRSALDESDETRRAGELPYAQSLHAVFAML